MRLRMVWVVVATLVARVAAAQGCTDLPREVRSYYALAGTAAALLVGVTVWGLARACRSRAKRILRGIILVPLGVTALAGLGLVNGLAFTGCPNLYVLGGFDLVMALVAATACWLVSQIGRPVSSDTGRARRNAVPPLPG